MSHPTPSLSMSKAFDTLPVAAVDPLDKMRHMVEIYSSVKGEGTQAGTPMTFVRFAGCNLACSWCDTPYRRRSFSATDDQLFDLIMAQAPAWVVFTGGEPLLQLSEALCDRLKRAGVRLAIESNGQVYSPVLGYLDYVCFSPKRFVKAGLETKHLLHPDIIKEVNEHGLRIHEIRYVVEGEWHTPELVDVASEFITFSPIMESPGPIPKDWRSGDGYPGRFGRMNVEAYNRCLELVATHRHRGARLSVQLHKFIGVR